MIGASVSELSDKYEALRRAYDALDADYVSLKSEVQSMRNHRSEAIVDATGALLLELAESSGGLFKRSDATSSSAYKALKTALEEPKATRPCLPQ